MGHKKVSICQSCSSYRLDWMSFLLPNQVAIFYLSFSTRTCLAGHSLVFPSPFAPDKPKNFHILYKAVVLSIKTEFIQCEGISMHICNQVWYKIERILASERLSELFHMTQARSKIFTNWHSSANHGLMYTNTTQCMHFNKYLKRNQWLTDSSAHSLK